MAVAYGSCSKLLLTFDVLAKKRYLKTISSANTQHPIKDKTVHYLFISRFFANTMLWAGRVKENDHVKKIRLYFCLLIAFAPIMFIDAFCFYCRAYRSGINLGGDRQRP